MSNTIRIGNAHGFWGDRLDAAAEMLDREPDLDFITLDFLAEVSMSLLAMQRAKDPEAGWPRDVVEVVRSLAPYWRSGGRCRFITNAGGLNPVACARACQYALTEVGCTNRTIVAVTGDDVLELILGDDVTSGELRHLDTGQSLTDVKDRLVTANAYVGADWIEQALALGADLVIAGRVADPSLTVGACAHAFGWLWTDWNKLAGATVAGHLIECGAQVTGGIATDWLDVPDVAEIGFPIVEVDSDGGFMVTKPRGTGGRVCEQTVKEQLVYEIGDPSSYLSPDVTASFLSLNVREVGNNRVRVEGAQGRPAPAMYKVSATYRDGFRAQGQLTVFGRDAVAKARRAGAAVLERLQRRGVHFRQSVVECLGTGACFPQSALGESERHFTETVLRVAVADESRDAVTRFTRELMPLITAGPPGTTGYADGRPTIHPVYRYWPCLIARERLIPRFTTFEKDRPAAGIHNGIAGAAQDAHHPDDDHSTTKPANSATPVPAPRSDKQLACLNDIATARSGDKGINANIGLVARHPDDFPRLCREATAERIANYFGLSDVGQVQRFELPNLAALNFVLHGVLANSLRVDAQGKTLGQALLQMPLLP